MVLAVAMVEKYVLPSGARVPVDLSFLFESNKWEYLSFLVGKRMEYFPENFQKGTPLCIARIP